MTNSQVDKIIARVMGKCWHKWEMNMEDSRMLWNCTKCRVVVNHSKATVNFSPSTSWEDYGEFLEWAKAQKWGIDFMRRFAGCELFIIISPQSGSHAFAEFYEANKGLFKEGK